ncbi:MAG: 2OG-Fe(II) oxygenase, partial [Pseudomonadota bacterium]
QCLEHFPRRLEPEDPSASLDDEGYKASFNPDELNPAIRRHFYALNTRPFMRVIENITGISGLIPDPYFLGAGLHEVGTGEGLPVRAEPNLHTPMNLERRVKLLIPLNPGWEEPYGGQLELWNDKGTKRTRSIPHIANQCTILTLSQSCFHGHPTAISHPKGETWKAIILYYYASPKRAEPNTPAHHKHAPADNTKKDSPPSSSPNIITRAKRWIARPS